MSVLKGKGVIVDREDLRTSEENAWGGWEEVGHASSVTNEKRICVRSTLKERSRKPENFIPFSRTPS